MLPRIYLDHAATSWPKLPSVYEASEEYYRTSGAASGRGGYQAAIHADRLVRETRSKLARYISMDDPLDIAFLSNGTHALNAALLGWLRPGDHVVTTAAEHNSVLRPLSMLERTRSIAWTCVNCDSTGYVSVDQIRNAMQPTTRLVVVTHASNVTGTVLPIQSIASLCQDLNCRLLVDAAQTLGYLKMEIDQWGIDAIAAPGHKGLGGLLGTGFLAMSKRMQEHFTSPWIGGTGLGSDDIEGPFPWRESLESGNLNVGAIASLGAGLDWLLAAPEIDAKWSELQWELLGGLKEINGLEIIGIQDPSKTRIATISVVSQLYSPQELSSVLASSFGIETRSGFHCAGKIHPCLGTHQFGGTLRISLGHSSCIDEIQAVIDALKATHA